MIKLQYMIWAREDRAVEPFANWALGELTEGLRQLEPAELSLVLTVERPPRLSLIPFAKRPVALLSLRAEEGRVEGWSEEVLAAVGDEGRVGGYQVDEVLPVDSERDWELGRRTPGVGLLTLLRRRRGLSDEELLRRWHGGHTPRTLKLHPVWRYERNTVERRVIEGSPQLDGIVEEHFRSRNDLLNPVNFFGGAWAERRPLRQRLRRMIPNMIRTGWDVAGFIDQGSMEVYLVEEFRLI